MPISIASGPASLARLVLIPNHGSPTRMSSSVWRSLRFGFSLSEIQTSRQVVQPKHGAGIGAMDGDPGAICQGYIGQKPFVTPDKRRLD